MRVTAADQKRYPRFAAYVRVDMKNAAAVPAIARAMNRIAHLDQARLTTALSWGTAPTIRITPLVAAYGYFTPGVHSNEIWIDAKTVQAFEAGRGRRAVRAGRVYLVGVTLLHELVHWGDDQDGVDRPGEEGEELERLLYGRVVF